MVIDKSWTSLGKHEKAFIPVLRNSSMIASRDIGETSNDPTQAKRNEFEELYAVANEELYPGCDHVTQLDFMEKFTYFKVKGKLTNSIFNEMLECFQNVFPTAKGYKLPPSYYAIKKTFKMIGLGYESIHACVNDCFLFRGDANKDVHFFPVCNTSRWKDSNTPRNKVSKKVLLYFLIIPRLQRLYKSSHTAKEMTWHATRKCTKPEPRNVRLGLAADGFNPFGNLSQSYSMWPVILTTYNLPPWLCMKESSFILTLLIPSHKPLGKDIDVYLRPLIDDLNDLWAKPDVETIDVATGLKFNMGAMVLWTINDFPARSSLSGWSGQGYKACPTCNEDTPSQYLPPDVAKPLIELYLFFKQICSQNLMVDDTLKAQSKMYPFERYMKKLKNYVQNEAKPEGSIAKGYVTEEALTFSSYYFRDVTTKFNRPDRNVDCAPPTCQFQIRQRHVDNDPGVNESSELFAMACGPSQTPISVNSCVVNDVRFVVHNRDERRTTQNNGICLLGPDEEMYYEDDPDVIHVDNSSDLVLSTSLNDLKIAALHIDGQSIDVDAPPDIVDVVDEDDDIIDEEDPIPHDLADSDDEYIVNLDIDDGMSADVARGHGDDGGGDDHPPPYQTQFDLRPHMESDRWPQIYTGIQQHLQKIYNGKKAALKERYWVPEEDGTYDLERIRRGPTREYPSLIDTFFLAHTVDGVFLNPEDKALYDEMLRLHGLGSNTPTVIPPPSQSTHSTDIARLKKSEKRLTKQVNMFMRLFRSDDKFSQMLSQLESHPEYGGGSGSGECGDDEPVDDEDDGEDEKYEDDS
nr:hypothetical protein [Tanacetum cinerariifolium]